MYSFPCKILRACFMVLNISFHKNTELISATKENIENIFTLFFEPVSTNYATFLYKRGEKTNQTT